TNRRMDQPRVIAVTGASGLVGRALTAELQTRGCTVRRLVRRAVQDTAAEIAWDPAAGTIDAAAMEGVDGVVHLAGENVADGRWTEAKKRRIVDSRVDGTRLISQTIAQLAGKPAVLVSASAIGFYGDRGAEPVDEDAPAGTGFLADTSRAWEAETRPAWEAGVRVVQVRVGLVLTPEGGLLAKMLPLFKLGLGGVLGDGRQYMSWITRRDLVRAFCFALESDALHGAVNGVAPGAVTNREFTRTLGAVLGRPTVLPAPRFALKLAMGQMADQMILAGANVVPARLAEAGFSFEDPELAGALRRLLKPGV
ncbi:MAG: TIGR01777 family oxidoreductase, partial [Planctomycetota bacterium]